MEKTTTLNLRVHPEVKRNADAVLSALGLSMTAAINIYLRQIALKGAIPFEVSLPTMPKTFNADMMSNEELRNAIDKGLTDVKNGNTENADDFFTSFRKAHAND